MAELDLDYAKPTRQKLQWRFIKGTALVSLFLLGWSSFSFYVWARYGNYGLGRAPDLVQLRRVVFQRVFEISLWLTGANLLWLIIELTRFRPRFRDAFLYLILALAPLAYFFVTESIFEPFLVE